MATTAKTRKTKTEPPDTRARVSVEGTEYRVTPEGLAKLNAPHWYHKPRVPGAPMIIKAPKASRDRSLAAWVARLSADFARSANRHATQTAPYIGRPVGEGYYLVATDGHRALCQRGTAPTPDPEGVKAMSHAALPSRHFWIDAGDDIAVALKRMKAAGSSKKPVTTLTVDAVAQRVVLSTSDNEGTTAEESVQVTGQLRTATVSLDTDYLLSAFGLAGLRLYLPDEDRQPAIVATADQEYRVAIMPIAVNAVSQAEDAPISALEMPATFEGSMYGLKAQAAELAQRDAAPIGKRKGKRAAEDQAAREADDRTHRLSFETDLLFEQRHFAALLTSTAAEIAAMSHVERKQLGEAWYAHQRNRNWPTDAIYDQLDEKLEQARALAYVAEHEAIPVLDGIVLPLVNTCPFNEGTLAKPFIRVGDQRWVHSDCNDSQAKAEGRCYASQVFTLEEWMATGQPVPAQDTDERYRSYCTYRTWTRDAAENGITAEELYNLHTPEWEGDAVRGDYSLTRLRYRDVDYVIGPRVRVVASATAVVETSKERPARSARAVAKRPSAASPVTEVPPVSVTAAPQTDDVKLTAGQKAWRTRQARIAAGAPPTDWVSAGRKAWETRMRNRQVAA